MEKQVYTILIVDDDIEFHKDTRLALRNHYICEGATGIDSFNEKLKNKEYDLILLDLVLSEDSDKKIGLDLLDTIKNENPNIPVVIITADGEVETVVTAIQNGASDYIHKEHLNYDILDKKFRKIIESQALKSENHRLKAEIKRLKVESDSSHPFIGETDAVKRIKRTLEIVAGEPDMTVLITGETGVGKEVAARYLHQHGPRNDRPFQAVNLSAIQRTLLESELFGHVKGAFTGASRSKEGYFNQANGGVLMLDEIGDIDSNIQIKLLRFLETKLIRPVGSDKDIQLDIQIVAATHKDLAEEVKKGNFREDLYQRLKAKVIRIPSLRERREDIPLIINHYLAKQGLTKEIITHEAMAFLFNYGWKGNIRELRYTIDGMLLERKILDVPKVTPACLPQEIRSYSPVDEIIAEPVLAHASTAFDEEQDIGIEEKKVLIDLTSIEQALVKRNKVKGDAAIDLGYNSSDNLRYRIKTYYDKYPYLFNNFPTIKQCYKKVFAA